MLYKKGKLMPAGINAYETKSKKMKRSNSKHNQSKEGNKFSSRRLSSNHEDMQQIGVQPKINNLFENSEQSSPSKKNFNSTASHPSHASYKKLTDVHNTNRANIDSLLDKSKKGNKISRAAASKQHNTSGQSKNESKLQPSLFDQKKMSADEALPSDD